MMLYLRRAIEQTLLKAEHQTKAILYGHRAAVLSEILKSYSNSGRGLGGIYYYRDKDKKEIDFLIENG